jgi:hypothetical protein
MTKELTDEDKRLIEKTICVAKKVYSEKLDIVAFVDSSLRGNKKLIMTYVDNFLEHDRKEVKT